LSHDDRQLLSISSELRWSVLCHHRRVASKTRTGTSMGLMITINAGCALSAYRFSLHRRSHRIVCNRLAGDGSISNGGYYWLITLLKDQGLIRVRRSMARAVED
ncbi:MAG TPA: hypothetical protein VEO92_03375, partial [Candidatus Nitrosocosmicus sp.]|nr:hypothetical protein [Candidatus Nitrosocosmicus sp.]